MADGYVIWGETRGNRRLRIGISHGRNSPIPFGAERIAVVDPEDLRLMRQWCEKRAKRGWDIERMKAACEAD